jgi:two-component system, OmpR family, sensor histidine kinase QseC
MRKLKATRSKCTSTIDNLVDNAIKYGREGGQVELPVAREEEALTLRVCDDGPGVALEQRARLTGRFFRVVGSGVEGSGLGLAIVARIATRYRGTVEIGEGLHGTGLGVTVRLPV